MENHSNPNSTEDGPNTSEQSTRTNNNQIISEWTERSKYKIPILSDRETDLTKINPKMWWEQISEYTPDIQPKPWRNHRSRNRIYGPTQRILHKG